MDSAPAISVVIPARDAAETLPRALEAVARQEGAPAYEVIVVDDGSRDETAAIAHDLGARVISADGGGPASARNAGVAEARGGLLAFTDADCVPTPGWLAAGAEALALGAELVQGRVWPSQDV
ncbi:MAG: glycosyl transferase family 2, partial [Solirubrobacterales bacterium]